MEIDTEVLYQWKDLVPTYERKLTRIENIHLKNVTCDSADAIYELKGNAELPIRNVEMKDIKVGTVNKFISKTDNVLGLTDKNISYLKLSSNK